MNVKRVFAMLLAVGMIATTGCSTRGNNNSSSMPSVPNVVSSIENGMEDLRSDIEHGISDLEDDFRSGDESEDMMESELESDLESGPDTSGPTELEDMSDLESESAAAAMSTDLEQIGALSAEKKSWGPGLNVDADNRPLGATDYQQKYGAHGAYFIAPKSNKIYLTFDEGYENGYTADILNTLKEKNVKAVFFITYDFAKSEPGLVKRMVDEGHILGNHSTKHKSFPEMGLEEIISDIQSLHDYVKANFGYTMTLFRPPMGEFSEQTLAVLNSMGYKSVFWSFAYRDWEVENQPLTIEALNTITSRCHPGAIYLLHAVSKTNAEVLGEAIDIIRGKGFEFTRFDWA